MCLVKMEKRIRDFYTNNKNIQSSDGTGIWHRTMCYAYSEKRKKDK